MYSPVAVRRWKSARRWFLLGQFVSLLIAAGAVAWEYYLFEQYRSSCFIRGRPSWSPPCTELLQSWYPYASFFNVPETIVFPPPGWTATGVFWISLGVLLLSSGGTTISSLVLFSNSRRARRENARKEAEERHAQQTYDRAREQHMTDMEERQKPAAEDQ